MRETNAARAARLKKLLDGLKKAYPNAHCELSHTNPLQLLVATILSAQCTDKRVNLVTPGLFARYRTAADFAKAPLPALEQAVKSTGFFRSKARNIQEACRALEERHGGAVPRTMEALTALSGVGRKTANVVLGNCFNINSGVVVDTHVGRLSQRMGLTRHSDATRIERDLMVLVPRAEWALFSHLLIWHGRNRCSARSPDCSGCELRADCPRIGVKAPAKTPASAEG